MPLTVSTRVLSERSGLPVRQVQTLSDAGVLKPDSGTETPGRGGSRQYSMAELDLAILLGSIVHKGISASEAAVLSAALRPMVQAPVTYGFKTLEQAGLMRRLAKAQQVQKSQPKVLQQQAQQILEDLKHVIPDTPFDASSVQAIEGWILIELAKQQRANPILLLARDASDAWTVRFWALSLVEASPASPHRADFTADDLIIEVKPTKNWPNVNSPQPAAGYFIGLRELFARGK
jgi:DNA-binding transcriptional MerR regulator